MKLASLHVRSRSIYYLSQRKILPTESPSTSIFFQVIKSHHAIICRNQQAKRKNCKYLFFETFFLKRSKFEKKINIRNKLSFIVPPFQKNGFSSEKNFSFKKLAEHGFKNVEQKLSVVEPQFI